MAAIRETELFRLALLDKAREPPSTCQRNLRDVKKPAMSERGTGYHIPFPASQWWRRRELNPGPKTVSTTDLHV